MVTEVVLDPWVIVSMFLGMFVFFQQLTFAREAEARRADYINPDRRQRLVLESVNGRSNAHQNKQNGGNSNQKPQQMDIEEVGDEEINRNTQNKVGPSLAGQQGQKAQRNSNADFQRADTGFKRLSSANFVSNPGFGSGIYNHSKLEISY